MSYARQLLDTYPRTVNVDAGVLATTIDALSDCAQACTACADDDLSEPDVAELVKCIRLCLDCADVCTATLRVASRRTEYDANVTRSLLEACRPPAGAAGTNASGMPTCTSTSPWAGRARRTGRCGSPATPCCTTASARSPTASRRHRPAPPGMRALPGHRAGALQHGRSGGRRAVPADPPRTVIPVHYEGWTHFRQGRGAISATAAPPPPGSAFQCPEPVSEINVAQPPQS
jgi:hypothetical protein